MKNLVDLDGQEGLAKMGKDSYFEPDMVLEKLGRFRDEGRQLGVCFYTEFVGKAPEDLKR